MEHRDKKQHLDSRISKERDIPPVELTRDNNTLFLEWRHHKDTRFEIELHNFNVAQLRMSRKPRRADRTILRTMLGIMWIETWQTPCTIQYNKFVSTAYVSNPTSRTKRNGTSNEMLCGHRDDVGLSFASSSCYPAKLYGSALTARLTGGSARVAHTSWRLLYLHNPSHLPSRTVYIRRWVKSLCWPLRLDVCRHIEIEHAHTWVRPRRVTVYD